MPTDADVIKKLQDENAVLRKNNDILIQADAAEKLTEAKIIKMFQDVTHLSIADSGWLSRCIADEKIKSLSDIQAFLERLARW